MIRRRFLQLLGFAPAAVLARSASDVATWDTPVNENGRLMTELQLPPYPPLSDILPDRRGRMRVDLGPGTGRASTVI